MLVKGQDSLVKYELGCLYSTESEGKPLTRPYSTYPPALDIRALSPQIDISKMPREIVKVFLLALVGLWSKLKGFTSPLTDRTVRESPALAYFM